MRTNFGLLYAHGRSIHESPLQQINGGYALCRTFRTYPTATRERKIKPAVGEDSISSRKPTFRTHPTATHDRTHPIFNMIRSAEQIYRTSSLFFFSLTFSLPPPTATDKTSAPFARGGSYRMCLRHNIYAPIFFFQFVFFRNHFSKRKFCFIIVSVNPPWR